MMRQALLLTVALGVIAAACGDDGSTATTQQSVAVETTMTATTEASTTTQAATTTVAPEDLGVTVDVRNFAFEPDAISVAAGESITFLFQGGTHTATAIDGSWASGTMRSGDSFTVTFDEPGAVAYFCEIHPQQMRAEVTVTG